MKLQAIVVACGVMALCWIGANVDRDVSADDLQRADESAQLREEVTKLRRQVEYLMIEHRFDESDLAVLKQHVQHTTLMHARIEALFNAGAARGTGENMQRCNHALQLALARLAFAKGDVDTGLMQMDRAVQAAEMAVQVLQNKMDAGVVSLSVLIAAQQTLAETQLERSRMQRRAELLARKAAAP